MVLSKTLSQKVSAASSHHHRPLLVLDTDIPIRFAQGKNLGFALAAGDTAPILTAFSPLLDIPSPLSATGSPLLDSFVSLKPVSTKATTTQSAPAKARLAHPVLANAPAPQPKPALQPVSKPVSTTAASTTTKVHGGADYQALQKKAAAGGLVDLEDSLLFGGQKSSQKDRLTLASTGSSLPNLLNNRAAIVQHLSEQVESFAIKPLTIGFYRFDLLDADAAATVPPRQTVLGIQDFHLGSVTEQPKTQMQPEKSGPEKSGPEKSAKRRPMEIAEAASVEVLNQQIQQLSQKIDKLNQALAEVNRVSH